MNTLNYTRFARLFIVLALLPWMGLQPQPAQSAPQAVDWPQISLHPLVTVSVPTYIANAGDGTNRLFIVQQNGYIALVYNSGTLAPVPFLDIHTRVHYNGSEDGLLSMAFPPNYAAKGYFYVYYTMLDGNNRVSRFHLKPGSPDEADPASETPIISFNHPNYSNHNGGQLAFGADGDLYISTGDGGGGGDPAGNAQNPASPLGKLLRIDVESGVAPYKIPATNPYTQTAPYRGEIWALGLRNPWRFSFDRLTHDLYIGDVGQDAEEEVDFQAAASLGGENYGWNTLEGDLCYQPAVGCSAPPRYIAPVATYLHGALDSNGCAVTGGFVYRGSVYPRMQGMYFYGDYCSGKIWGLVNAAGWQTTLLLDTSENISTFGEDEAGSLYLADLTSGTVYLVTDSVNNYSQRLYMPGLSRP